ncbi:MAG: hypothetical protein J6B51_05040 [Clostridia bacterium]|nr:hypothetical protein [Clostridia bacterium]
MYPALRPKRMSGNEPLLSPDGKTVAQLIDFWSWAYSDLVSNAERGALAEYIVACALGIASAERVSWDKYDLMTPEGISIEVKTSGYIQSWHQKQLSSPLFGIRPTYGWNYSTNQYDNEQKRQSDIYVFCVHKHTDKETVNPLLIEQWNFYLMPTAILNEKFNDQKSASLHALIKAGAELCPYENLSERIRELIRDK